MPNESFTIDRDPLLESFGQWHDENDTLAIQINESVAALTEYQKQLETWQTELDQQQSHLSSELSSDDDRQQEILELNTKLNTELNAARKQLGTMSADLLAKTEELRQLDKSCAELSAEVERLRTESAEVENDSPAQAPDTDVAPPAATENEFADELKQMRALLEQYTAAKPSPSAQPTAPAEAPVGSVAAQFNKLRQQQAAGRTAKKSRK